MSLTLFICFAGLYSQALLPFKRVSVDVSGVFYSVTNWPRSVREWLEDRLTSKEALRQDNESLRSELLIYQSRLQRMAALSAENIRLHQLLNSSKAFEERVLIGELIGITPNPNEHKVTINRGERDGVYVGQPLLDASGLMGQVVLVGESHAQVLLISDATHAIPVQVNRTGERFIAEGVGKLDALVLRHIPNTADIKQGDILVSSGLGLRFPKGYPVAKIASIEKDVTNAFADVRVRPLANLNSSRYVLLLFDAPSTNDIDLILE